MKIGNFGSFDPALKEKGIVGLTNSSKLDEEVWNEYYNDWDKLGIDAEEIIAKYRNTSLEVIAGVDIKNLPEGKERETFVKTRINHQFFRDTILVSYNTRCAITGLNIPELLIASHIVPWAKDKANRLHPTNGICLNALHDKAFDKGLLTITNDYKIKVSKYINDFEKEPSVVSLVKDFDGKKIILPNRFLPASEFLEYHNNHIFIR
ncbi:HNH endonuclease [Oscillatoria amoena NRMC-F 0135]|nr:HNH endonuclease [Oscillatoria amoena NRMC-F 0135]